MFKNYLTFQFALNFDRICCTLPLSPPSQKDELMRLSRNMLNHFTRSLHTKDPKERSKSLLVAVLYLRDCRDLMLGSGLFSGDAESCFDVLHGRLEKLCLDAADAENGQLRIFA